MVGRWFLDQCDRIDLLYALVVKWDTKSPTESVTIWVTSPVTSSHYLISSFLAKYGWSEADFWTSTIVSSSSMARHQIESLFVESWILSLKSQWLSQWPTINIVCREMTVTMTQFNIKWPKWLSQWPCHNINNDQNWNGHSMSVLFKNDCHTDCSSALQQLKVAGGWFLDE